jgi:hypothetical protein
MGAGVGGVSAPPRSCYRYFQREAVSRHVGTQGASSTPSMPTGTQALPLVWIHGPFRSGRTRRVTPQVDEVGALTMESSKSFLISKVVNVDC